MTPGELYRTCRFSAYRLEAQQHYDVPGDEDRQRAFHRGDPLPPPRQSKIDDLRLISDLRGAGRRVGRVHIITWPLSAYVRYELVMYTENVAAGEDVRITERSAHEDLVNVIADFAIFDSETDNPELILFDYAPGGRLRGYEYSQEPGAVAHYRRQYRLAIEHSVSLQEFLDTHEISPTR